MRKAYKLEIQNKDYLDGINEFFRKLFSEGIIDSLLVQQETVSGKSVVHVLARTEEEIAGANPFAPLLLTNSATLVSRLTVDNTQNKTGVVLRSCEIRALVELVKLKQASLDNVIIIGVDCAGTYESEAYQRIAGKYNNSREITNEFLAVNNKTDTSLLDGEELRPACLGCEYPNPFGMDISINYLGCDVTKDILIQFSGKLEDVSPEKLGLVPADSIDRWTEASKVALERRTKYRDDLFKETLKEMKDVKVFLQQLEHCRRCGNCRSECPICYCRECIFDLSTFEHESEQYFEWAKKKGKIRMPTDTLLFHLTRMNHMVISCVACGQCTSACPNGIPIAKFFKTTGFKVQELFGYKPGRSVDEENPQSTFKEDEFHGVGDS
ncbi:MAG: 4Fe-4S dicluster domain-containing protein [Planctomycetota bacterium]|jgi:formate dehydrogenase subunit beta